MREMTRPPFLVLGLCTSLLFGQTNQAENKLKPVEESRQVLAEMVAGKHGGGTDIMLNKAGARAFLILALLGNDSLEDSENAAEIRLLLGELDLQVDQRHYYGGIYDQAYVTLGFARLASEGEDKEISTRLQACVDYLVAIQNEQGGWRYNPTSEDVDSSVVASVVLALGEARKAGAKVPEKSLARAAESLLSMQNRQGGFAYVPASSEANVCRTAMAVRALPFLEGKEAQRNQALHYLSAEGIDLGAHWAFAAYHLAFSAHELDDPKLAAELAEEILSRRGDENFWAENKASRLLPTALCVLALQELENTVPQPE